MRGLLPSLIPTARPAACRGQGTHRCTLLGHRAGRTGRDNGRHPLTLPIQNQLRGRYRNRRRKISVLCYWKDAPDLRPDSGSPLSSWRNHTTWDAADRRGGHGALKKSGPGLSSMAPFLWSASAIRKVPLSRWTGVSEGQGTKCPLAPSPPGVWGLRGTFTSPP